MTEILTECRRVMHGNRVTSHVIDYSDHYARLDGSITSYNFFQLSALQPLIGYFLLPKSCE
jgi:hypothetical protein